MPMNYKMEMTSELKAEIDQERKDFPLGGGKHTFIFTISMRGDGCDYSSDSTPYKVKAYDLVDAIKQLSERPFVDWMEDLVEGEN